MNRVFGVQGSGFGEDDELEPRPVHLGICEDETPSPTFHQLSTLILAWGNDFRRDDGAGRVAARRLRDIAIADVEIVDFNQLCPEHAELLEGRERVIFLDAYPALAGQGALLLPLDDPQAITLPRSCFGHAVQPTEIMTLAAAVYDARPEAWLAAIPGFDFNLGETLSPATEQGIQQAIKSLSVMLSGDIAAISPSIQSVPCACGDIAAIYSPK